MGFNSFLVTGAGGFIGSHLVERLVELNLDVRALVRYNSRNDWGLIDKLPANIKDAIDVRVGDLRDPYAVRESMNSVDAVFHLGAYTGIPYSYSQPIETLESNVMGTANVLMAARDSDTKVINVSSSEVYGTALYVPINEEHPLQPQSPYSASKIGAEMLAKSFFLTYDLPVVIVRPFNTYGPRQFARDLIPTIITQILVGSKVKLGSLETTRDYTYVEDIVDGIISAVDASPGEIINLGSNCEISAQDLVKKIASLLNKDIKIETVSTRIRPKYSEVQRLRCDNSKARDILKWQPKFSFDFGLRNTIEWIQGNLNLYKPNIYNI